MKFELLTWDDDEGKSTMWHSSAHLMAEAIQTFYPDVKFAIGPPIENGFYYDIEFPKNISFSFFKKHPLQSLQRRGEPTSAEDEISDHVPAINDVILAGHAGARNRDPFLRGV